MADLNDLVGEIDWGSLFAQFWAALLGNENVSLDGMRTMLTSALTESHAAKIKSSVDFAEWIAGKVGSWVAEGEKPVLEMLAPFLAPIVAGMFDTDVDASLFASRAAASGRAGAVGALVDAFLQSIRADAAGAIEPGDEGARRVATAGLHAALEGWFMALLPEVISDVLPFEIGHFEAIARLPEEVISALGIGRLVRRALTPLVNAVATTPAQWAANIEFRPTKLAPAQAVRQYFRGRWTLDQLRNSLAIDGYRDELQDALINGEQKFLDVGDLRFLYWQGIIALDEATQTLRDQGWDEQTASKHIHVDGFRRTDTILRTVADAAITAYVDGRIEDGTLDDSLNATIPSDQERGLLAGAARSRRALRQVPLSPAEAEACVLADVLAVTDYRDALARAGRTPDAIDALELLLRMKLDKQAKAADLKQQQAAAKAAKDAAAAKAAAAKRQQVADALALKQQGALATIEDAAIRGLISLDTLQARLSAQFDAATVAIYLADVEDKRQQYLNRQQQAADAAKRAANKGLSPAQLEIGLVDGILTAGQVADELQRGGLDAGDVAVLVAEFQQKAVAAAAANKLHAQAAQKATAKHLSLAKGEALVIAGHWTIADYNALLSTIGYVDADVAALDALLQDRIDKAAAAHSIGAAATAASPAKGLSLAQFRAAVVAGVRSIDDFQAFLVKDGYTPDAVSTLIAETSAASDTAAAARQRRIAVAGAVDGSPVSLHDLTRAAQLGILAPADYAAALTARGYNADDVALELDLLSAEIAAAGGTASASGSGGTAPAAYAAARHVTIDGQLAARGLSLAATEKAVTDGLMTLDAYVNWLQANGYGAADAELLRALLAIKLNGGQAPAPPAGG